MPPTYEKSSEALVDDAIWPLMGASTPADPKVGYGSRTPYSAEPVIEEPEEAEEEVEEGNEWKKSFVYTAPVHKGVQNQGWYRDVSPATPAEEWCTVRGYVATSMHRLELAISAREVIQ